MQECRVQKHLKILGMKSLCRSSFLNFNHSYYLTSKQLLIFINFTLLTIHLNSHRRLSLVNALEKCHTEKKDLYGLSLSVSDLKQRLLKALKCVDCKVDLASF